MKPTQFPNGSDYLEAHLSLIDLQPEVSDRLSQWVQQPHDFLLFLGTAGCGKTYFCAALMNLLKEQKKPFFFLRESDFFDGLRNVISQNQSYEYEIEKVSEMPFLILDDLGTSQTTEFQKEALFTLIDRRSMSRLPMVITSNHFLKDMAEKYSARFKSRLAAVRNTIIELRDVDLRQKYF